MRLRTPTAGLWRSPLRGPWLTSFLGTLLVPTVVVMALTGFISHWAYQPGLPGNATINPAEDIPVLLRFPAFWPSWDFAVNQGVHVTLGFMMVPIVLAKLWSVIPKLFQRPIARSLAAALERVTMVLLVASVLVEMATGILAVDYDGPPFNLFLVHYYGAWIFATIFVLHACVKLPTVRKAYRTHGVLKPLRDRLADTVPEPPDASGLVAPHPAAPTISRRGLLAMIGGACATIFALQAGDSIGGPFRRFALFAAGGRVFAKGPNDFSITVTAATAGVTRAVTGTAWRVTVIGARTVSLSRDQLLAMAQSTHAITLTCTEGWSTTQRWTGVPLADLASLVDAPPGSILTAASLQEEGGSLRRSSFTDAQFRDRRSLLALKVNGVDISLDHGYPARVILPGVPGVHNTKWVRELRFETL
jgi:hypothetical protein